LRSVARIVVIADFLFTATAVVVRDHGHPARRSSLSLLMGWILLVIALYLLTGRSGCRGVDADAHADLAAEAVPRPSRCRLNTTALFRLWFAFGFGIRRSDGHLLADVAKPQLG